MSTRAQYSPGPAAGAEVRKEGQEWTLVLVRTLKHPPTKVWAALSLAPPPSSASLSVTVALPLASGAGV